MGSKKSDIIIVVMGPTGAGKSNLIDKFLDQSGKRAGNLLESKTDKIQATRMVSSGQSNIVIVDTPGFGDPNMTDTKILQNLDDWLKEMNTKPTVIVYLHRINDQIAGDAHRYTRTFGLAPDKVILVTSMWDKKADTASAEAREADLKKTCWQNMINNGSTCARFLNTRQSAAELIKFILAKKKQSDTVSLREDVEEMRKRLQRTEEGKFIYAKLEELVVRQEESVRKIVEQATEQDNAELVLELDEEYKKIWNESQHMLAVAKAMKFLRFIAWLSRFITPH